MAIDAGAAPLREAVTTGRLALAAAQALLVGDEVAQAKADRDFMPGPPFTRAALTRLQASLEALPGVLADTQTRMGAGAAGFNTAMQDAARRAQGETESAAAGDVSLPAFADRLRALAQGPVPMATAEIHKMLGVDGGDSGGSRDGGPVDTGGGFSVPEPVAEAPSAADAFYMPIGSFAAETIAAAEPHIPGVEGQAQRAVDAAISAIGSGHGPSISDVNATITGIVVGAAFAIGGWVGAGVAALASLFIPRMLMAIEELFGPDPDEDR